MSRRRPSTYICAVLARSLRGRNTSQHVSRDKRRHVLASENETKKKARSKTTLKRCRCASRISIKPILCTLGSIIYNENVCPAVDCSWWSYRRPEKFRFGLCYADEHCIYCRIESSNTRVYKRCVCQTRSRIFAIVVVIIIVIVIVSWSFVEI